MALTTQALAHRFGKPITGLPIPVWRRVDQSNLLCEVPFADRRIWPAARSG